MASSSVIPSPFPGFLDVNGDPLEGGYIYVGVDTLEPITNPITVYWDAALTIPASQPIRTIGGYPSRSGSPAAFFTSQAYSITIKKSDGTLVYSSLSNQPDLIPLASLVADLANASNPAKGDALLGVTQPYTGAVARTQHAKNSDYLTLEDFGAVADGLTTKTDNTAAITTAFGISAQYGIALWMNGYYYIPGNLTFNGLAGLTLYGSGAILGNPALASPKEGLLVLRNCSEIYIDGHIGINPQSGLNGNTNYASAICTYADYTSSPGTFTGTIVGSTLTLNTACTGSMALGQYLTYSGCPAGIIIGALASGVLGASGSTYTLSFAPGNVSSVAMTTNILGATSHLQFVGVQPGSCLVGWQFGKVGFPNAQVSEISVFGGVGYGVLQPIKCIGSQTLVNFIGCQTLCDANGWVGSPTIGPCITSIGSVVNIVGGELNMTTTTTGTLIDLQPTASSAGNVYGSVTISNAGLESASKYALIENPGALPSILAGSGLVQIMGCSGYHGSLLPAMVSITDAQYSGKVCFLRNNLYAALLHTATDYNVASVSSSAHIYLDDMSFSTNFLQGLQGISGGIPHFDYRTIFQAANCNSQALTGGGTPNTLKWTTPLVGQDTVPYNLAYSAATGIFTVPAGGLKSVNVSVDGLKTSGPTQVLDLNLYIGGALWGSAPTMMGGAGNGGRIAGSWDVGDLAAGTTIYIQAAQTGAATTAAGGVSERITIRARN